MIVKFLERFGFKKDPSLSRWQRILEMAIVIMFFFVFFVTIALNNISPFNYVNIGLYFVQIVLIIIWCFKYGKFAINYYLVIIIALNLLIFISGLLNNGTPLFYSTMITLPISSFFFSLFLNNERNRDRVLAMFSLSFITFLIVFTSVYFQEIVNMEVTRIGRIFADQNLLGYIFAYGFIVLLDNSLRQRVYPLFIFCAYTLFLIFATGSRSTLIISIIVTFVYIYKYFGKKRRTLVIISALSATALFAVLLALPAFSDFRDRILGTLSEIFLGYGGDTSTTFRMQYILDGIEFSIRRLIFGYGANEAALIMSRSGQSTHNNLLDMTLNYGILFTIIFEGMLIFFLTSLNKNKSKHAIMLFSVVLAIFIVQFFFPNYWTKPEYLFFPFMVGVLFDYGPQFIVRIQDKKIVFQYVASNNVLENVVLNEPSSTGNTVRSGQKILIILTYCYPFNPPREVFLHNELRHLARRFDKVVLVPTARMKDHASTYNVLANNIETLNIKRHSSLTELLRGFIVRGLFHPPFWADFFRVIFKSKTRRDDLNTVFRHYLINGYLLSKINKALLNGNLLKLDNDYLVYSYWLNGNALLGTMMASRLRIQGLNCRVIARAHGLDDLYVSYRPGLTSINKGLDAIFPISEIGLRHLVNTGIKTKVLEVSRLGVAERNPKLVSDESNPIRFISCSMLTKNKRIDLIVEALARLGDLKVEWTHFGDGEEMTNLTTLCKNNLSKNIKWKLAGNVENDEIIDYLLKKKPRCMINTSAIEGIPVTIMEAFSCGVPAIAPNIGAISEIIDDGVNGVLLPRDFTIENLAAHLKTMAENDCAQVIKLRTAALKTWNDLYSADKNYESFADKCSKLIE